MTASLVGQLERTSGFSIVIGTHQDVQTSSQLRYELGVLRQPREKLINLSLTRRDVPLRRATHQIGAVARNQRHSPWLLVRVHDTE